MLVAGVTPPGIRHAHAEGDVAHDHQRRDHASNPRPERSSYRYHYHCDRACHHADCHADDGQDADRGPSADIVKQTSVAHVHFAWLWFDVSLPVRDQTNSDRTSGTGDKTPCVVRLLDDCIPASPNVSNVFWIIASAPAMSPGCLPFTEKLQRASGPPDFVTLLCDSARHVRSGVQLT